MATRDEILAALAAHPEGLNCPELLEYCPNAEGEEMLIGNAIAGLRREGVVRCDGFRDARQIYFLNASARSQAPAKETATPNPPSQDTEHMTIADKIVEAIKKHGPMTVRELRTHVKSTTLAVQCSQLAKRGTLRRAGGSPRRSIYDLPSAGSTPPTVAAPRKAPPPPTPRAAPAPAVARPSPAPSGNGHARFAIDADGTLGILKHDQRVDLEAGEFAALRQFIERAQAIWSAAA